MPRLPAVAAASTAKNGSTGIAPWIWSWKIAAIPANATPAAASLSGVTRSSPNACANSADHSGTVANSTALSPEGSTFSPQ